MEKACFMGTRIGWVWIADFLKKIKVTQERLDLLIAMLEERISA